MADPISKSTPVKLQLGFLFLLVAGVWTVAYFVFQTKQTLIDIDARLARSWSVQMEQEAWRQFKYTGETPNAYEIKRQIEGK